MAEQEERLEAAARSSVGEKGRAEGRVRFLRARGSAKLRKVVSGFATQNLCLRNRKARSQVSGEDRSRFPGRRTVWEIWGGGRRGRKAKTTFSSRREAEM